MDCSTPGLPHHSPEFAQVHVHCISDAIQPSHPLTLFSLCSQSFPASGIFPVSCPFASDDQNTEAEASVSVLPVNIQGWSPLRLIGLNSLAAQGTLRRLLQYHSLKASLLWCSAFFMVQFSQPYVTTGKTIALTILTFVSKVMSLLFNTQSRFVITFLPRINHLLISWLQSQSAVILEPKKRKSITISTFSSSIYHSLMRVDAMILVFFFFNIEF